MIENSAQSRRWASAIAVSSTSTTPLTNLFAISKLSSPTRFAPSESAASDLTVTSTGSIRLQRGVKRARTFRLDANDLDAALEPGGYAGDKAAAAHRDEDRVELLKPQSLEVLLPLERDRPLARDRFDRIVRMDQERAAFRDIGVAALLGLGVGSPANHGFGAVSLDLRDLGGRGDLRHEDARADAELLSSVCDGRAVVAARSGRATGRGCGSSEKVVEGAARLERTGLLQAFELQRKRRRAGDRRGGLDERRATNVIADSRVSGTNFGRRYDGVRGQSWRSLHPWLGARHGAAV